MNKINDIENPKDVFDLISTHIHGTVLLVKESGGSSANRAMLQQNIKCLRSVVDRVVKRLNHLGFKKQAGFYPILSECLTLELFTADGGPALLGLTHGLIGSIIVT